MNSEKLDCIILSVQLIYLSWFFGSDSTAETAQGELGQFYRSGCYSRILSKKVISILMTSKTWLKARRSHQNLRTHPAGRTSRQCQIFVGSTKPEPVGASVSPFHIVQILLGDEKHFCGKQRPIPNLGRAGSLFHG
jgi:hypothetical protein